MAQHFEAWWWRRYLAGKPVEEYLDWKKKYWTNFLADANISVSPNDRLLDAGCGPAGIFMAFSSNKVQAIDPLLGKYRTQLPHFREANFPKVTFRQIALEQLSDVECFEKIFCLNAINHVADLDVCLQNLYRALAPGGQLFLTVDAHNFSFLKKIFRLIPGDILHPHQLDLGGYLEKLDGSGFTVGPTMLLKHETIFDYHLVFATKSLA